MANATSKYQQIYAIVKRVPRGKVATYGDIAKLAGLPKHARLVGYALHALPADNDSLQGVPWHRIVNAKGMISLSPRKMSSEGNTRQRQLLQEEGVQFDAQARIDLKRFRWKAKYPLISAMNDTISMNDTLPLAVTTPYILIMGVCGTGKSSLGLALANSLPGVFIEADDHHSTSNRETMRRGQALTDAMRWPWLATVADATKQEQPPVIIACSALKRSYRDYLRQRLGSLLILHIHGERDVIQQRLQARKGHFMPASLLDSQLEVLEIPHPDEHAVQLDLRCDIETLTQKALDIIHNQTMYID